MMITLKRDIGLPQDRLSSQGLRHANVAEPGQGDASDGLSEESYSAGWLNDVLDTGRQIAESGGLEYVLVWVGLSVLVAIAARWRDHSAIGWFLLSLIITPFASGMYLLVHGKGRVTCRAARIWSTAKTYSVRIAVFGCRLTYHIP